MKKHPPTRKLREHPDLDQLKRQAKEMLDAFIAGNPDAVTEVTHYYRDADRATFALHDAQLVLARAHGFDSWPKLKAYIDGVTSSRLCEAVDRGDIAAVRDMLRRRPEIVNFEWPKHGEARALHVAVLRHNPEMVRFLMESGANAHDGIWPNRDSTSAMTIATERQYDDIVAIIRAEEDRRRQQASGPDVHAAPAALFDRDTWESGEAFAMLAADPSLIHSATPDGATPLHAAAATLSETAVVWLLDRGADPNCRARAWTPLDLAASGRGWGENGGPEQFRAVAKVLLDRGAELTDVSAVALDDQDWVRARHAEGKIGTPATIGIGRFRGLLTIAVKHDRPEMLSLLLDLGLDPDERARVEGMEEVEYSSSQPLYACAQTGKLAMAKLLLDRGADPNGLVYASGSATYTAYRHKDQAMIDLLEAHGGVLDAASVGYLRQTDLARKMLAGEVAPRLEVGSPFSGETVAEQILWSGASGGDPEIVRMSLERVDWPRDDRRWFWMLWRPLPGHGERPEEERPLFLACFRMILERCDPNLRAENGGQCMLHEVIARDNLEGVGMATALLDAGARTDMRDNLLQSTPLGWACRWGRTDLVKLLLARGADPIEPDAEPWATPRAWAEKMGHDEILAILREATR